MSAEEIAEPVLRGELENPLAKNGGKNTSLIVNWEVVE